MMKLGILIAAGGSLLLWGACATTQGTPEEYAACRAMQQDMGTADRHDHGEAKGQGRSGMNLTHSRCRQVLSQPAPAGTPSETD